MGLFRTCLASLVVTTFSFSSPPHQHRINDPLTRLLEHHENFKVADGNVLESTRADFLQHTLMAAGVTTVLLVGEQPALARGRATLEFAYEKYVPRIIAGGEFYKSKMKGLIGSSDFNGIKVALAEPPQKSKEDRAKVDGGVSERAAQAGDFSDSRVIVAMDLFASQFSDNSISPKTKAMKKEVDELRAVVQELNSLAKQALGEESVGGGFFGLGKKQPSKSEISNRMKELYIAGGTAWNRYVFAANDGLPVTLNKLPYL